MEISKILVVGFLLVLLLGVKLGRAFFLFIIYLSTLFEIFFFNQWKRPSSGTLFICTRIELTLAPFSNYPRKAGLEPWILDPQLQKKNKKKQKKQKKTKKKQK